MIPIPKNQQLNNSIQYLSFKNYKSGGLKNERNDLLLWFALP